MSYRSGALKEFDRQLLTRSGIPTQGRTLLQREGTGKRSTPPPLQEGGEPRYLHTEAMQVWDDVLHPRAEVQDPAVGPASG